MRKGITVPVLFMLFSCLSVITASADTGKGLTVAVRATLENHPAVKGKLAELSAYGYNIDTAKSGRYPSLSGEVQTLDSGYEYGTLIARQPLWAFGKIQLPIDQASERYQAERLSLLQVQRQLIEETATAYAQILGIRRQLEVAVANIDEHRRLYERIKNRQQGELASDADVQLALSRLIQARSQKEQIVGELQIGLNELQALTQVRMEAEKAVPQSFWELPEPDTVRELAIQESANVRYKKRLIDVARYNVSLQKVNSTPTLYAEARRDFFDSSASNETRVGLTLQASLDGAGFGIKSRTRSASAQVAAAREDWRATINSIELRVNSLLTSLDLQTRLQLSRKSAVDAVEEIRESFIRQYDSGRKTWLEVLNIQREYTQQLLSLVQAESDELILRLRVAALIGRLDTTAGIEPVED